MRKSTKILSMMLAGAMTLSLAACGGSESEQNADGTTTITLWHGFTEADGDVVQTIADKFNKSQQKYKVEVEKNPWSAINEKLMSGLSSGTGPDILTYQPDAAKGYIQRGAFVTTDDFYSNPDNETDVYRENVVADGEVDGKHYGVPMGHAPYSVYFNKAIFEKAGITEADYPKTMEELAALAQKLTIDENGDGTPEQYGIALADKDSGYLPTFLQGAGTDLVVDGKAQLTSNTAKDVLTWVRDNFYAKKASPGNIALTDASDIFVAGKAAMFIIGPWMVATAKSKGIDVGTFEVPAGTKEQVTLVASNYWYLTSQVDGNDAKKQGAYEFMKYFNNKENQLTWAVDANYPPNRTDITTEELGKNALIAQISPYMDKAKILLGSVPTGFADVQSELNALGPKISSSEGDLTEILKDSNEKIQGFIEE